MTTLLTLPRLRELTLSPWGRAVVGMTAFLVAGITASSDDGTVLCPLRRCSGGYCPGCGLTRSSGQLIRGDLAGSWRHHPYILLALAQIGILAALFAVISDDQRARLLRYGNAFIGANAALLVAIWVARMASGAIPIPFA